MDLTRRDFMKLVGISAASLAMTRCTLVPVTCYAPLPPSPAPDTARDRLRCCWLRFNELAQDTQEQAASGRTDSSLSEDMVYQHRIALDELVVEGQLTSQVSDLIQEAYEAAVYHIWRSNAPITCYEPMIVDYAPSSAGVLVHQVQVLQDLASQGTVDPALLDSARLAIEHDLAYYALTDEQVDKMYEEIISTWNDGASIPGFDELDLEIPEDAETAARFIIDLLVTR
jgi:hypothetical protein